MSNIIKIDDPATIAWIQEHEAGRQARKAELEAYQAEIEAKLEGFRERAQAEHKAFWKKMEEVAPATIDGDWKMDLEYLSEGIAFLKKKEPKKADESGDMPAPVRALMEALGAKLGGRIGVAEVKIKVGGSDEDDPAPPQDNVIH